jgi:hypothetical protein
MMGCFMGALLAEASAGRKALPPQNSVMLAAAGREHPEVFGFSENRYQTPLDPRRFAARMTHLFSD